MYCDDSDPKKGFTHAIAHVPDGHVFHKVLLCDPARNVRTLVGTNHFYTEAQKGDFILETTIVDCPECLRLLKFMPMPEKAARLDADQMILLAKLLDTIDNAIFDNQVNYAYMRKEGLDALDQALRLVSPDKGTAHE